MSAVDLPQSVAFQGKTSKGSPVAQSGRWELQNFARSPASIIGKVMNEAENSVVVELMRTATSRPFSGSDVSHKVPKKKTKMSMPGSDWVHSDIIYSARCSDKWCEKQFQIRRFEGMLALYTFKEHGGASTEATTVLTTGHDVDTRSSISMPTAKGATLLSRSMKSRVPNVQASVSQKKRYYSEYRRT
jgi:hypothetical protein